MSNSFTKTYADGDPLLADDLDNGFESVQPSLANLALGTTGSTSGDVLKSNGSNVAPSWETTDQLAATFTATGANIIGASMTSTGANAIFADVTSCIVSVADLIGITMDATGVVNVINRLATTSASSLVTSTIQASAVSLILQAESRAASTTASYLGIALSNSSGGAFQVTSSTFTDVTNLTCDLTVSGNKPVEIQLLGDNSSNESSLQSSDSGGTALTAGLKVKLLRGTTTVGILRPINQSAVASSAVFVSPCVVKFVDYPIAGQHTYTLQAASVANTQIGQFNYVKLQASEKV